MPPQTARGGGVGASGLVAGWAPADAMLCSRYAPINIMPHYPPYGQMAGNIGALAEGGCPYSRAFDYL